MQTYNNVTPNSFLHPNTCHDSIEGDCMYGYSPASCLQYCKNNNCTYGYYAGPGQLSARELQDANAQNAGAGRSICFASPSRSIHPLELVKKTNKDINFFMKSGVFETKYGGNVNYMDKVFITNSAGAPLFSGQPFQIWKAYDIYVDHLRYGDSINLRKFMTNIYLYANICTRAAEFVHNSSIYFTYELDFFIKSPAGANGEYVKYGDEFYMQTKNKLILTNNLDLLYKDPGELQLAGVPFLFKFNPEFDVYYCSAGKCQTMPAVDSIKPGAPASYRSDNCYLNCRGFLN